VRIAAETESSTEKVESHTFCDLDRTEPYAKRSLVTPVKPAEPAPQFWVSLRYSESAAGPNTPASMVTAVAPEMKIGKDSSLTAASFASPQRRRLRKGAAPVALDPAQVLSFPRQPAAGRTPGRAIDRKRG
jgi:hypothetical protein